MHTKTNKQNAKLQKHVSNAKRHANKNGIGDKAMETILFFLVVGACFVAYLVGYCAGSCDKQKEMDNQWKLTL